MVEINPTSRLKMVNPEDVSGVYSWEGQNLGQMQKISSIPSTDLGSAEL
jgi:hypothetical protein